MWIVQSEMDNQTGASSSSSGQKPPGALGQANTENSHPGKGDEGHTAIPPVSLPKGGGAIRDIGEKFAVNAVTGTASVSIPITLSKGRSASQPSLDLNYNSGSGNGPFGLGWSISLPKISRKTEKGLPKYLDGGGEDVSDVFTMAGEDLVPTFKRDNLGAVVVDASGALVVDDELRDGYLIRNYAPRIQTAFTRVERWTSVTDPAQVYWRATTGDNITTVFGVDSQSRVQDPATSTDGSAPRIMSWLASYIYEDVGNAMLLTYKPEDSANVPLAKANELNRSDQTRSAGRYLKSVKYGNTVPNRDLASWAPFSPSNIPETSWNFSVVFDYGEHDPDVPTSAEVSPWLCRKDSFSNFRSGFEIRTYRLCRRILIFHHFSQLQRTDYLIRSLDLTYDENPVVTYLTQATQVGYLADPVQDGPYLTKSLPPLEFAYSRFPSQSELQHLPIYVVDSASLENIPAGVGGATYRWMDLDGEGISGIFVEDQNAWYYKHNISHLERHDADSSAVDGDHSKPLVPEFGPLEIIDPKPNATFARTDYQMMDIAGDGHLDVVQMGSQGSWGFFRRENASSWADFQAFPNIPNVNPKDAHLRFVDVTGDGLVDILVTENEAFTWYNSLGDEGYIEGGRVAKHPDEETGPRLVFADPEQTIYLADASGDGLTDLVRVRNGDVCYWPSLGYAQFGAKVQMDNAPWFDNMDQFNQKKIHIADLDGSGTFDIVYVGLDGVDIYLNQSGNGFQDRIRISVFPPTDNLSTFSTIDLFGNGTPCLVWSSPLPQNAQRSIQYIDVMSGKKAHLLVGMVNNLGTETKIHYAPSTKFYLADKLAGKPWVTRLPFPVHCVEKEEIFDYVSHNRFENRYAYHDGYFDGAEREFRGFALVEKWDTEDYSIASRDSPLGISPSNTDPSWHIPPTRTKTWFHTGAFFDTENISRYLSHQYFGAPLGNDVKAYEAFYSTLLGDSVLPMSLTGAEIQEGCRALKGQVLRKEIYSEDSSEKAAIPYLVVESNYTLHSVQSQLDSHRHAVFSVHPRETISYHYERNLDDPRIDHDLTLEVDKYGNVLKSIKIAYGRKLGRSELTGIDLATQQQTLIIYNETHVTGLINKPNYYQLPKQYESLSYQLYGLTLDTRQQRFSVEGFTANDFATVLSLTEIPFETKGDPQVKARRIVEQSRVIFRSDDLSHLLPLGQIEPQGIIGETYNLIFTPGLLAAVFQRKQNYGLLENLVPDATQLLGGKGGDQGAYVSLDSDSRWWVPKGRVYFSVDATSTPEQELAEARNHFFRHRRQEDPFGNNTVIDYDSYDLVPVRVTDAVGSVTMYDHDYRTLFPTTVTDVNGNRTTWAFDELGFIAGSAVMGKITENVGDSLEGFRASLTPDDIDNFFQNPTGPLAATLLGSATSRIVYSPSRFWLGSKTNQALPNFMANISRETHVSDSVSGSSRLQIVLSYFDGFGREIEKKAQAEPGPLTEGGPVVQQRWVASGWTIFNNKGSPVKQYEPFFDDTHDFKFENLVGVSPIMLYDSLNRLVAKVNPDHTWTKSIYTPWQQIMYDTSDTALESDPKTDEDVGALFSLLPDSDYLPSWYDARKDGKLGPEQQDAAIKTAAFTNTPTLTHYDPLGRSILNVANNGKFGSYSTRVSFDIQGNTIQVTDARNRVIEQVDYDMLGGTLHRSSMDAGERWQMYDATKKSIRSWDSRSQRFRTVNDELRRPIKAYVMLGSQQEILVGLSLFGDATALNQRGRLIQTSDQAGVVTYSAYDFKGNPLRTGRQFATEYKAMLDWSMNIPLEAQSYESQMVYDALNRKTQVTTPDQTVTSYTYNVAGMLDQVQAVLGISQRGVSPTTHFIKNLEYNAKGQRSLVEYDNNVTTSYMYDPLTFRLVNMTTLRGGDPLQNLNYSFDASGNITQIRDDAQQTIYFRNQIVNPTTVYTYDPLYRLIQATGREHLGQANGNTNVPTAPGPFNNFQSRLPSPGDGNAMGTYTESYSYDSVGNLLTTSHSGSDATIPGWTRNYVYSQPSEIEQGYMGNRLSATTVGSLTYSYGYDGSAGIHGNITSMPHLSLIEWDYKDQLHATAQQVVTNGRTPETTWYVYDSGGQRARKVTERQSAPNQDPVRLKDRMYIGGYEVYQEYDGAGLLKLERESLAIMDDKQRIALIETRIQGTEPGLPAQLIRLQFSNQLGSSILELDGTAQIISYEEYTPFGNTSYQGVRSAVEAPKRYRFMGKERDEESGFYYCGARYYSPWIGRWINADPVGIGDGVNLYGFVQNNPINRSDPSGRTGDPVDMVGLVKGMVSDANKSAKELVRSGRVSLNPRNKGAFGELLHTELTKTINDYKARGVPGADRVDSEVSIDRATKRVISVGVRPLGTKGSDQIDVIVRKEGTLSINAGDTFNHGEAEFIVDAKASGKRGAPKDHADYAQNGRAAAMKPDEEPKWRKPSSPTPPEEGEAIVPKPPRGGGGKGGGSGGGGGGSPSSLARSSIGAARTFASGAVRMLAPEVEMAEEAMQGGAQALYQGGTAIMNRYGPGGAAVGGALVRMAPQVMAAAEYVPIIGGGAIVGGLGGHASEHIATSLGATESQAKGAGLLGAALTGAAAGALLTSPTGPGAGVGAAVGAVAGMLAYMWTR